jgi:hypothetical protein
MWYPETEIELNLGMDSEVYRKTSATIRIDAAGG